MSNCETNRRLITEAVLGELSEADESELRDHLQRCADCRGVLSETRRAAALYDEHAVPHPPEKYWAEFTARLHTQISAEEATPERSAVVGRIRQGPAPRRWPLRVAAAIVLFALGILVGRVTVDRTVSDTSTSSTVADAAVDQVLTRALTLFLNLSKADPPTSPAAVSSAQMQAAERLLRDTRMLQSALEGSDDVMLSSLIDDVELVLLQYTNSSTRHQARAAMDELGILLRINLYIIDRDRADTAVNL